MNIGDGCLNVAGEAADIETPNTRSETLSKGQGQRYRI